MQLLDGRLQLDDVGVSGLDVGQGLLSCRGVHDDALEGEGAAEDSGTQAEMWSGLIRA